MKDKEKPIDICKVHCKDFACRKYVSGEYCDDCKKAIEYVKEKMKMNDKEMIEEMAQCKNFFGITCSDCDGKNDCGRYELAKELIDKDIVVLSMEEYEILTKDIEHPTDEVLKKLVVGKNILTEQVIEKTRKETAEKYHNFVNNSIKNAIKMYSIGNLKTANIKDICSTINLDNDEIAKHFGVEIEES